eukprot:gene33147-40105_t
MQIVIPDGCFPKLSNQALLEISLCLFLGFAIAEIVGAYYSTSLSLLGDAVCMCVDVTTYVGNAYVEWVKGQYGRVSVSTRWVLEVYMPSASVLALVLVTIYITYDATKVLYHPPRIDSVDVDFLYGYSMANLLVDILCGVLFYMRSEDVFAEHEEVPRLSLDTSIDEDDDREFGYPDVEEEAGSGYPTLPAENKKVSENSSCCSSYHTMSPNPMSDEQIHGRSAPAHKHRTNVNMLTAFAHILGDTLRTVSMFVAAAVSSLTGVAGDICDAWAAVLVCVSIVGMCAPIVVEIYKASLLLRDEDHSPPAMLGSRGRSVQMTTYSKLRDRDFDESDGVRA